MDIFFNFGEADRGISVYYRERPVSHEDVGKKERVRYFKEILEYLGFHVDVDTQYSNGTESYGLKAVLNKDYGMNEAMDLIDIASHVVEVFKFSTNVDYDLRSRKRETQYEAIFEKWLRKEQLAAKEKGQYHVELEAGPDAAASRSSLASPQNRAGGYAPGRGSAFGIASRAINMYN